MAVTILTTQHFLSGATDFSTQQRALRESGARVVVLYCQASDGGRFLRTAFQAGVGAEGFPWLGSDALIDAGLWQGDADLASDVSLRERVLKGFFSLYSTAPDTPAYQSYVSRRRQLPHTNGNGAACNLETDDDGNYLWAQDVDNNAITPLRCLGFDPAQDGPYDSFGYDAVFAVAHALHDLIEVQNHTSIVGSELLDALIKHVSFEGVTGRVEFYDASSDPDRLYDGDRRVGLSYTVLNYVDSGQGLVSVGSWAPCEVTGCSWSERWQSSGVSLTYSTADNSQPIQLVGVNCGYGAVLFDGTCVCDDGFELDRRGLQCRRCDVGQDSRRPSLNSSGSDGCTVRQ